MSRLHDTQALIRRLARLLPRREPAIAPARRRHVADAAESACLVVQRHGRRAQAERIVREAAARPGEGPCLVWAA